MANVADGIFAKVSLKSKLVFALNKRPGRGDFAAETLCCVTLARNNCFCTVSSLFVSFAKETCQTCDNNKSHIYCHLLGLFAARTQQFRRPNAQTLG